MGVLPFGHLLYKVIREKCVNDICHILQNAHIYYLIIAIKFRFAEKLETGAQMQ